MNQRVFEYLWLDTNLRKALENDQLVIHYQPENRRGRVRSLETLVRWQSPERGLIPPLDFISHHAEESGLIVPLRPWVILDVVRR